MEGLSARAALLLCCGMACACDVQADRNLCRCRRLPGEERGLSRRRAPRPQGLGRQQQPDRGAARSAGRARRGRRRHGRGRRLDRRAGGAGRHRHHRRRAARQPLRQGAAPP